MMATFMLASFHAVPGTALVSIATRHCAVVKHEAPRTEADATASIQPTGLKLVFIESHEGRGVFLSGGVEVIAWLERVACLEVIGILPPGLGLGHHAEAIDGRVVDGAAPALEEVAAGSIDV